MDAEFNDLLGKTMSDFEMCYYCTDVAMEVCRKCGKPLCPYHYDLGQGYCGDCSDYIDEDPAW